MYEKLKKRLTDLAEENGLLESEINITAKILTPKEAIGETERKDFPLLKGKEFLIQADFRNTLGQAFTDAPCNFNGQIKEILDLELKNNSERALFVASLNAVMRHFGGAENTIHCKDKGPELCAHEIVNAIITKHGADIRICIVGFQPAIIDNLVKNLTVENVDAVDLDQDNIHKKKYGVCIQDGKDMTKALFKTCDVILATGSTAVNDTMAELISLADEYHKALYFYGTTVAGTAKILNLQRLCFQSY
ncbi:MAG: DUF364 domain-containing protein [Thermodesulfobacteriota bacterium]|nr:DUF364 domain-containing protein [Thermodesulfobacteriota bacterium]